MKTNPHTALIKVQALSGAVFALFLFAHLVNLALATLGPQRYDALQQALRAGYQAPVLEIALVLVPMLVHVGASLTRWWGRRREPPLLLPWRARLHRWSGRFLLVVFVGHVGATRGASVFFDVFPGFEGIAFTLRWVPAYFWPYYLLLAVGGWYHLVHGLWVALPVLGVRASLVPQRQAVFRALVGVGAVVLVAGVLALGGVFFDVGEPTTSAYARLVLRLTGSGAQPRNAVP